MQMRAIPSIIYRCYVLKEPWKGVFDVERWNGEMVERFPCNKSYQAPKLCHHGLRAVIQSFGNDHPTTKQTTISPQNRVITGLTSDPVF